MEIVDLEEYLNSQLRKYYKGQEEGFVQVGEKKWLYPRKYRSLAEKFKNFEVRSDDIWITGYPRSGTTLTQDLAWLMSHDFDYERAKNEELTSRVKFFEVNMVSNPRVDKEILKEFPEQKSYIEERARTFELLKDDKQRRVIKTHLPFELLPPDILTKGCKVIYVSRFPKDVCVSYYLLQTKNQHMDFCGGFEKYWKYFRDGISTFGPYFEHVKQGFEQRDSKNFLFVNYEEFRKNSTDFIKKLSEFLEVPLSGDELKKLENYIDFDNFQDAATALMKDKPFKASDFIRKGKVGGWKDYFTEEMSKEADEWIEKNTKEIGIRYS